MLNYCPNCMATIMDNTAAQCTTCGGTGLPGGVWPQDQWLGEEVDGGRYTVTRLLGRGGFGQVYEVHHTLVEGRVLAMKMLNEIASGDPTREQEFLNEIKILMTLEHPHVVKCYEAGRLGDGALFVLMEKIDGQELGSVVYEPDHLYSPEQTIRMGLQIASALGAAHGQGLLHRDLKPANILVLDSGDIRVVDFGIAKILGPEPKGQLSQVIGTPLYMAPEQFTKGADVDGRLDIYQLGAVLHFALTGQPPYPLGSALSGIVQLISAQQSRVGRPGPSPSEVRPRLSDQAPMLDALVADMLSTDIHMRPESTQVVEQRLQQCLAALTQRPSQASVPTQPDVAVPKPWPDTPPSTIPKPPQPDRTATYVAGGLIALVVVGFGCVAVAVVGLIAVLTVEKTAEQHFDDGLSSFDSARMDEAATSFQAACDKEHAPACLRLGVMFEQGKHTERDVEQAATLYRTACRLEEPEACNRVGVMYEHGTGLEQNNRKAFKAYSESCKGGYALGCTNVGWMYNGGRGVKKNLARAKKYYSKGCDKGSARGCTNLGVLYERGQGVKADPKRAFALYTRGCKDNDPIACTNVGWMYFNGRGVKKNVERAAHFYQKGCDKGSVKGCNNLGVLYETGDGLEKDPTKAKKLYAQACDRNDYMACNNLGTLHDKDKAFSKANALYTRACQNDYSASCTNLGLNHQNGRGVPADDEQATRFYRQACELGNGAGCTNLGWMYKKGRGVPQKTAKAVALYKEGCDKGDSTGCNNLKAACRSERFPECP